MLRGTVTGQPPSATATSHHSLRSDEPILSRADDRLSRGRLVEAIAAQLLSSNVRTSLVVGLNAPWGAGKSSFLNLLAERLAASTGSKATVNTAPIVIPFNPWNYANVRELVRLFFAELAVGIGADRRVKHRKRIGKLLTAFGPMLGNATLPYTGPAAPALGGTLKGLGTVLRSDSSLDELKKKLDAELKKLSQRIVVFIDDIDRLEPDVTKLIFRMIRLNANFPNLIYVLAFDRTVVERHLRDGPISGRDYLEKLIQVSFDIPQPEPQALFDIFCAELDAVLTSIETRELEENRYTTALKSSFDTYFQTVRNIKRYTNNLRLTLPLVAQEVNLVDFLVVEIIRLFHPEVYARIAKEKGTLTPDAWHVGLRRGSFTDDKYEEELRARVDYLCQKLPDEHKESVVLLLQLLFPEVDGVFKNAAHGHDFTQWRRDCRICSPDVFDKFFLLAIPSAKLSEIDLAAFRTSLADPEEIRRWFAALRKSGRIRDLLERLDEFVDELPAKHAANLARAVCDSNPAIDFQLNPNDLLHFYPLRIILQCIRRQPTEKQIYELVLELVNEGHYLLASMELTDHLYGEKAESGERLTLGDEFRRNLWKAAQLRLQIAASGGELWKSERWYYMLWVWIKLGGSEQARQAVSEFTSVDEHLLAFLEKIVESQSRADGRLVRIDEVELARWLDVESIIRRLTVIKMQEDEQGARASKILELLGHVD